MRLFALLLLVATLSSQELRAPPLAATVEAIQRTLQQLHPVEYGARRSAAERAAYASQLLVLAAASADKPDERYVLLREAVSFAARSGEVALGFQALEHLEDGWRIPADLDRLAFASEVAQAIATPTAAIALIDGLLAIADHAIARDEYPLAIQATGQADAFARRLKDRSHAERTRALVQRVKHLDKAYRELGVLHDLLGEWTASGHRQYGWFLCVQKLDWTAGLDHLRQGDDETLRILASDELAATAAGARLGVADRWYAHAQTLRGQERVEVLAHAALLYQQVSVELSGLDLARANQQLTVLAKELGPRLMLTRYPPGAALILSFEPGTIAGSVVADQSPQRHRGQLAGAQPTSGLFGSALRFDGNARVTFPNHPSLQTVEDCTIAMWLQPDALAARRNPWNKSFGGEGTWTLEPSGVVHFFQGTAGGDAEPYEEFLMPEPLVAGAWTHLAVVRNGAAGTLLWYKDGVEVASDEVPYPRLSPTPNDLIIGHGYAGGYSGLLDEILLYPRALSAAEIQAVVAATVMGRR